MRFMAYLLLGRATDFLPLEAELLHVNTISRGRIVVAEAPMMLPGFTRYTLLLVTSRAPRRCAPDTARP